MVVELRRLRSGEHVDIAEHGRFVPNEGSHGIVIASSDVERDGPLKRFFGKASIEGGRAEGILPG